jgi:nicotinamidase/pyrazinamidase
VSDETSYGPKTALVVVDVQNDFADPTGSLYVGGGEEVVPVANREIGRARSGGAVVTYTQDWHPPTTPHFERDGGVWPVHCVRGTWGAELHPDLAVEGAVFRKGQHGEDGYSGFTMRDPVTGEEASTGLAEHLRDAGVRDVVVLGLAGDVCVKETVLDAIRRGFGATVLTDGVRSVNLQEGDDERAVEAMADAGAVIV